MARIAAVIACGWLCAGGVAAAGPGQRTLEPGGVFRRRIVTSDGVPLALYRYQPAGGGHFAPPVLLIADVGFNREMFDLHGFGLAPWLRARGRDVFVLEPRGHGASGVPEGWHLADIARRDLPAAVAAIHAARGAADERIDIVAHGFSGALAIAAAAGPLAGDVGRVALLATPAVPEVPNRFAQAVLEAGGSFSTLPLDPAGAAIFELLFARHGRFSHGRLGELRRTALGDLSATAAHELLDWMRTGDLPLGGGDTVRGRLAV
ncbi:MAG: hypothetical protein IRZ16_09555 [Myxococcaceae bacterium]|nr:hypothetical protein [Myxococcaceae bacterium]